MGNVSVEEKSNRKIGQAINRIYTDDQYYNEVYNNLDEETRKNIDLSAEESAEPYKNINVSDAQVLMRPECYRRIKIGLGEW
jgi:hypothetical protein